MVPMSPHRTQLYNHIQRSLHIFHCYMNSNMSDVLFSALTSDKPMLMMSKLQEHFFALCAKAKVSAILSHRRGIPSTGVKLEAAAAAR